MPLYNDSLGMIDPPAPGVHQDVPQDDYHRWNAVSGSLLQSLRQGEPLHCRAILDGFVDDDTQSRRFGSAVHMRLLEPDRFEREYAVADRCQALIGSGPNEGQRCKNWGKYLVPSDNGNGSPQEWRCGSHAPPAAVMPERYLTSEDAAYIEAIRARLFGHDVVRLLRSHGGTEVSLTWRHSGYDMKGRLDKLIPARSAPLTIIDVKSTQRFGARRQKFSRSIAEFGYALQAAFYVMGCEECLGETPQFIWIVIEKDQPHDVGVYLCDSETIEAGRVLVNQCREELYRCLDSGIWNGSCWDQTAGTYRLERNGLPDRDKRAILQHAF